MACHQARPACGQQRAARPQPPPVWRPSAATQRRVVTCGVERSYSSTRSLRLALAREDPRHTAAAYLSATERVVQTAFPDAQRRRRLDAQHWRVQLLPVQLLWLTAGVECTLRTWSEPASAGGAHVLRLSGREVALTGLPGDLVELAGSLVLRVDGSLQAHASGVLGGSVRLRIAASLPDVLAIVPGVDAVVQRILDGVLQRIELSLREKLPEDYLAWVAEQRAAVQPALAPGTGGVAVAATHPSPSRASAVDK